MSIDEECLIMGQIDVCAIERLCSDVNIPRLKEKLGSCYIDCYEASIDPPEMTFDVSAHDRNTWRYIDHRLTVRSPILLPSGWKVC